MDLGTIATIAVGTVFVNNFVLAKFLGLCPFMGVSKKTDQALGMGFAVIFVMTLASIVTWFVFNFFLKAGESNIFYQLGLIEITTDLTDVLKTLSYILVIASLVQLVEMAIRKLSPALFKSLGIFLPLITTNCAVLGVTLMNTTDHPEGGYNLLESIIAGFFAGVGFLLVIVLMSGIRERLELLRVPESLKGLPITFIASALMALAFMGFVGMI
jgi:electron transport complex protein RnfA